MMPQSVNKHSNLRSSTLRRTMMVAHFQLVSRSSLIISTIFASSLNIFTSILPVCLRLSTNSGLSEVKLQLQLSRGKLLSLLNLMKLRKSRLLQNFRLKLSQIGRHQFNLQKASLSKSLNFQKKIQANFQHYPKKRKKRSRSGSRCLNKCAKTLSLPKMKTKKKTSTTTSMMKKRVHRVRRRAIIPVSRVETSRTTMTLKVCAKISSHTES